MKITTIERRKAILSALYKRKCDKIANLSKEFAVSPRTIRRDIEKLSLHEPIYTIQGRYYGGIYIVEDSALHLDFFNDLQTSLLTKILKCQKAHKDCTLTNSEIETLTGIIKTYRLPETKKKG